jgi:hypothetical protein
VGKAEEATILPLWAASALGEGSEIRKRSHARGGRLGAVTRHNPLCLNWTFVSSCLSVGGIAMRCKTLVVLIALAVFGTGSTALAKGGGGKSGGGMHGHFAHHHFHHRFPRNSFFFGDGFGWGWGGPYYGDGNGSNTTVVVFPQAIPRAATGSVDPAPCHWNEETFKVPSSTGGPQPISVVSCR